MVVVGMRYTKSKPFLYCLIGVLVAQSFVEQLKFSCFKVFENVLSFSL